jgi:hypothetical protein
MGNQIIRQPDGEFAIFSTITDTIIMWDATAEDIEQYFVKRAADDASRRVLEILRCVSAGEPNQAYYQFTMTWDEALKMDEEHGGDAWEKFP